MITDTKTQNEKDRIAKEKQKQAAEQQKAKENSKQPAPKKLENNSKVKTGGLVEEEPDSAFKPQEEDVNNVNLQSSDF